VWNLYDHAFWDRIGADKLPAGLNYAAFDFAVNSGPAVVDGDDNNNPKIVEDFLLTALKEDTVEKQIDKLCDLRLTYMQSNPEKWAKYKRGWSARVARVRSRAHHMAA
jgi:lysozyme family protein